MYFALFVLQRKALPRNSVEACIYNIKFYSELLEEPLTQTGVSPCFDGRMEPGVFFSGEGAYLTTSECFSLVKQLKLQ